MHFTNTLKHSTVWTYGVSMKNKFKEGMYMIIKNEGCKNTELNNWPVNLWDGIWIEMDKSYSMLNWMSVI